MDSHENGMSEIPGAVVSPSETSPQAEQTLEMSHVQAQGQPEEPTLAPKPKPEAKPEKRGGGGMALRFLVSVLGGGIGAALIVGILFAAGVFGQSGQVVNRSTNVTVSGSNQPVQDVTINASRQNADVSEAVASKTLPSVVSVYVTYKDGKQGSGSGVIFDKDGNIVTNYHVIENCEKVTVSMGNTEYDATVVGYDASSDLAVLHADFKGTSIVPIEIGDSSKLVPGSWVMSVGSPFGLEHSVSAGIVSALSRGDLMQTESGEIAVYANLIQVDAAINPGNSGGALVDSNGKLVGICTLFSSDTKSFAGIGFAIPGNYAVDIARQIISGKQVTHAYLGLSMQTVNERNAKSNDLDIDYGAYVADSDPTGPATKAGIKNGDIIVSINGKKISSSDEVLVEVRSHSIGDVVTVDVIRDGESKTFKVTLGSDEALSSLKKKGEDNTPNSLKQKNQDQDDQEGEEGEEGEGDVEGDTEDDSESPSDSRENTNKIDPVNELIDHLLGVDGSDRIYKDKFDQLTIFEKIVTSFYRMLSGLVSLFVN